MLPGRFWAIITFAAAWAHRKVPNRFTSMTRFQSSGFTDSTGKKFTMPTLFIAKSMVPYSDATAFTVASTCSGSDTSQPQAVICRSYRAESSAAAALALSAFTSMMASSAPA